MGARQAWVWCLGFLAVVAAVVCVAGLAESHAAVEECEAESGSDDPLCGLSGLTVGLVVGLVAGGATVLLALAALLVATVGRGRARPGPGDGDGPASPPHHP